MSLTRSNAWNSTIFKGKLYFYEGTICVFLLYVISIWYLYLYGSVCRVWHMYTYIHAPCMIYVYINPLVCYILFSLCYIDWLFSSSSSLLFFFCIEGRDKPISSGTQWCDSSLLAIGPQIWLILYMTLIECSCLLVDPSSGMRRLRVGPCRPISQ